MSSLMKKENKNILKKLHSFHQSELLIADRENGVRNIEGGGNSSLKQHFCSKYRIPRK